MYLYYYEDDPDHDDGGVRERPRERPGVDFRPTVRAALWWALGCVILAAVIVATDVAGVQIPQMYLDLTADE